MLSDQYIRSLTSSAHLHAATMVGAEANDVPSAIDKMTGAIPSRASTPKPMAHDNQILRTLELKTKCQGFCACMLLMVWQSFFQILQRKSVELGRLDRMRGIE